MVPSPPLSSYCRLSKTLIRVNTLAFSLCGYGSNLADDLDYICRILGTQCGMVGCTIHVLQRRPDPDPEGRKTYGSYRP
jgi:hypothetical protein